MSLFLSIVVVNAICIRVGLGQEKTLKPLKLTTNVDVRDDDARVFSEEIREHWSPSDLGDVQKDIAFCFILVVNAFSFFLVVFVDADRLSWFKWFSISLGVFETN